MSAASSAERIGVLERLTDSTVFAVLFACAVLVLAPLLLFGLVMLPYSLALVLEDTQPDSWAMLLLPLGGAVGVAGQFLTGRPPETLAGYRIMMVCIAVGIATALTTVALLFTSAVGSGDSLLRASGALLMVITILAALGRVERVSRLRAAAEGRAQDDLPLIFLAVALVEAGCAIAIVAQLASGG